MGFVAGHAAAQPEPRLLPFNVPVVFGPARPAQYSYRIVTVGPGQNDRLDEAKLNALGKDGWLLVSVLPRATADGSSSLDYLFVRTEP